MTSIAFCDILTDFTCATLLSELTKFILYNKQQIPISYDKLFYAVNIASKTTKKRRLTQSDKLLKSASECVDALEETFSHITKFLSGDLHLEEVVLFFGASLVTPKQVYRLHFPRREFGHLPKYHARQQIQSELLKFIIQSSELNKLLSTPLAPTNMYLLFKIEGGSSEVPWFIHRPRYKIPSIGQQIDINCSFKDPLNSTCSCKGFEIYSDEIKAENPPGHPCGNSSQNTSFRATSAWYQAPLVLKGFKDIYENGVSVSRNWMTCPDGENIQEDNNS